ncbi:MAG: FliA/WhiG family RNA polymerase sigma factor [Holophagales bacterium]|jgi:RNA polymerase sigma factor for flagellar operon FliA|nr:FliA/WhiG family RNA polymerase sigma factor [Holophagales bacterium]
MASNLGKKKSPVRTKSKSSEKQEQIALSYDAISANSQLCAAKVVSSQAIGPAKAAYRSTKRRLDTKSETLDINQETLNTAETTGQENRDDMIMEGIPLVKYIAYRIASRVPSHVDVDDLINSGIMGLIEAAERFEPERNVKFKTYAEQRIRGAILDDLRGLDWVPRALRRKKKDIEGAYHFLEQQHGRAATDEEVATFLNIHLDELHKSLDELKGITLGLFTDSETQNGDDIVSFIPDPDAEDPSIKLHEREIREILKESIKLLPTKERLVVQLYYFDELTMKEIGTLINITESRVSQLHTKAMLRLRGKLRSNMVNGR